MADRAITITAGKRSVEINDKDLTYVLRLIQGDLRYLEGRSARARGADANGVKAQKRRELLQKLESLKSK